MVPLSSPSINRRLKLGKEDPARVGERRGLSADIRPERAAGVDSRRQRRRGAGGGGADRAAAGAEPAHSRDLGHGDVGGDRRQAVSARRHPSIRALRLAALRHAVPRSLAALAGAVHRVRPVAEPDPVERRAAAADGADQRPDVAALVSALAPDVSGTISALLGRFDVCLAQSQTDAERFAALGSRNVVVTGNLKLDVPAPPADSDKLERLMAMTRGRPVVVAASTHPGEEEILTETHRTLAGYFPKLLTVIVPRHPDRGEAIARMIAAAGLNATLRSHEESADRDDRYLCRRHHGRTGIVLPAGADRVHGRIAGRAWRTESDRGDQARRVDRARSARVQFHRRL